MLISLSSFAIEFKIVSSLLRLFWSLPILNIFGDLRNKSEEGKESVYAIPPTAAAPPPPPGDLSDGDGDDFSAGPPFILSRFVAIVLFVKFVGCPESSLLALLFLKNPLKEEIMLSGDNMSAS